VNQRRKASPGAVFFAGAFVTGDRVGETVVT